MTNENEEKKSSTWRDIVSVLTLFYLPPIGVIVMWLVARWSTATKWVATILIGIIPLVILATYSYNTSKFVKFQRSYAPVLGVQQALDIYGIANGKYPTKLNELQPKYLKEVPSDKELEYTPSGDGKNYVLKAVVEGKEVELQPAFSQIPEVEE